MKKIITITFTILIFKYAYSQQNLVPNPGFENYSDCPSSFGQASLCIGWQSFRSSPDYWNSCSDYTSGISVPKNDQGYQIPANGNAYIGLIAYSTVTENDFECIGTQLVNPLTTGTKYFVSFKVSLSSKDPVWCNSASDHLGVTFSKNVFTQSNPKPLNNTAKVYSNNIIQDTLSWTMISGSFIADSAYKYIIIGNFYNTANINTTPFFPGPPYGAYYFIDDVKLATDSIFVTGFNNIANSFLPVSIFPNPINERLFIKQPYDNIKIEIFNFSGDRILIEEFQLHELIEIKTDILPQGIYFIVIEDIKSKRIITKQKFQKT